MAMLYVYFSTVKWKTTCFVTRMEFGGGSNFSYNRNLQLKTPVQYHYQLNRNRNFLIKRTTGLHETTHCVENYR